MTTFFASQWIKKWNLSVQLGISAVFIGVFYAAIGWADNLLLMMVAAFATGIFNAVFNLASATFWQQHVPYERLGRFISFTSSIFGIATLIGMALNAYVSQMFSAKADIMAAGSAIIVFGIILTVNIKIKRGIRSQTPLKKSV
jgi:MFS family permease